MKVQVKKGGLIYLPKQTMAALAIKEQDILDCSLAQSGILLKPVVLMQEMGGLKKN